jgi:hypothetical protein
MFAKRNREMKREKSSVTERMEKENEEMEERIRQCVRIETDRKNPLAEIRKEINMQRNLDNWLRQDEGLHEMLKAKRLEEMYGDDIYKDAPLITGENKNGRITLDNIPITIGELKRIKEREHYWTYNDESFERTNRCTVPRCNKIMDGIAIYKDYEDEEIDANAEVCQEHSGAKKWRGNKVIRYIPWGTRNPIQDGAHRGEIENYYRRHAWENGIHRGATQMLPAEVQHVIMQYVHWRCE